MAPRVYTIPELLELRGRPVCNGVSALASNPEIAPIVRESGSESSDIRQRAGKSKDDSSASSEEVLFRGNISRRGGRENLRSAIREPIRESFREREPAREPIRESAREPVRELPQEISREPTHPYLRMAEEWKYHGRSESEVASGEPVSAPTGVPAQRSEGFQRFYKAVVSPTHVRVTAGGRIVPNTRGPPSPTTKRSKDGATTDGHGIPDKATHPKPSLGQIGLAPPVPMMPQFIPGYPPGFQPLQAPVSFIPMAFGTPLSSAFPFGQPTVGSPPVAQKATDSTLKDTHNTKPGDPQNEDGSPTDKQDKVKITPPEFFDYTKPFYYNGQYIYPVASPFPPGIGSPMVPIQMVNLPPGLATQLPLPGYAMQTPTGGLAQGVPAAFPASNPAVVAPSVQNHAAPVGAGVQPQLTPISSIKPSEITRKQISTFKQSLKYHEDQLQYNRHQIDEKDMESKIQTLRAHIQRFETTLKTQLEYEQSVLHANQSKDEKSSATLGNDDAGASPQTRVVVDKHEANPSLQDAQHGSDKSNAAQGRKFTRGKNGASYSTGESSNVAPEPSTEVGRHGFGDYVRKPGLPTDAALAPVFRPRGYASSLAGSDTSRGAQEECEKRLLAIGGWKPPKVEAGDLRAPPGPYPFGLHDTSRNASKTSSSSSSRGESSLGVPYLLGTLPKGVNPRTARDQDYVYNRPLNEEERRARFLYWGKAPKSVIAGLPKYDGKHFYPPSPVKERTATPSRISPFSRLPSGRAEIDNDPRGTKSELDPFRPVTPVHKPVSSKSQMTSEVGFPTARRINPYNPQLIGASEDLRMSSEDADYQEAGAVLKARENSADAATYGQHDRRSEKSGGAKLWPAMIKKGSTSSAVSSTTAQGFLPQYSGHAAASLSPTVKNMMSPIRDTSPGKMSTDLGDRSEGGALLTPAPEIRRENLPPNTVGSLEDQFKNLSVDGADRRDLPTPFKI